MPTVISAILLDPEARANDAGGNDLPADGHMQEPALFIPGLVRAFSGTISGNGGVQQNVASVFSLGGNSSLKMEYSLVQ